MTYVIADIHGEYEKYKKILEMIRFSDDDTLYILGDVVDRGPEPMRILQDMMLRSNVIPIIGNHEFMALQCLTFLMKEVSRDSIDRLDADFLQGLQNWFDNGGEATMRDFHGLSGSEREEILEYLGEFSLCEEARIAGCDYLLVHAGLENFAPDRPPEDYAPYEMLFGRPDYGKAYFPDKYVVTGHTPTMAIPDNPRPGRIFRANNHIAIDCGCGYGGPLGAICLDTGEEFYAE